MNTLTIIGPVISAVSAVISITGLTLSRKFWLASNRPIVLGRITTPEPGNLGATMELILKNYGNRPAIAVKLEVDPAILDSVLLASADPVWTEPIRRCFTKPATIPVLGTGETRQNYFGGTSSIPTQATWNAETHLPITIHYEDIDGRGFSNGCVLFLAIDKGFAGTHVDRSSVENT